MSVSEPFLKVFQDADNSAHDASQEDPFPAYLEGIDTSLAPFCPTSATRVLKALTMANLGPDDQLIDLGSGDGRFCTAAVAEFDASRAVGIESDSELIQLSKELCRRVLPHQSDRVTFVEGDLLVSHADSGIVRDPCWTVIVLFLLPDHTDKFADLLLEHYHRGARIISLVFNLNEIEGLNLVRSDERDGIYIYAKDGL
ncbi:hypothetical protein EC973_006272 [Apophysomyces ossiformis]|uniref:DOT1 domain-containing protein n=1 Tax=Apophysomyces ossiformis TaxID=679940 RepID=A0A8H7EUL7_9FUNG|nr:hypothetical protein EC973_006272 [Apophysomyces ossiformis]